MIRAGYETHFQARDDNLMTWQKVKENELSGMDGPSRDDEKLGIN